MIPWPNYFTHVGRHGGHPDDSKPDTMAFVRAVEDVEQHGGGIVAMKSGHYIVEDGYLSGPKRIIISGRYNGIRWIEVQVIK